MSSLRLARQRIERNHHATTPKADDNEREQMAREKQQFIDRFHNYKVISEFLYTSNELYSVRNIILSYIDDMYWL